MRPPVAPLFVPGDRPERFGKAAASGADAVVLDLEDAVAAAAKPAARDNIRAHGLAGVPVLVRVNATDTAEFAADLACVRAARPDAVMVAKAEDAAALAAIGLPLLPLIETSRGMANLSAILAVPAVIGVGFGSLDYALDLGCEADFEPLIHARSTLVFASRLAGKGAPLDGVTPAFDDPERVAREARRARAMGFGGKLAIHPRQVAPIKAAFLPDEAAVRWARDVVAADAGGAVGLAGAMVDKPLVERARRILAANNEQTGGST